MLGFMSDTLQMTSMPGPIDEHRAVLHWARSQQMVIHGIEPAIIPGKGVGIVASRTVKVSLRHNSWYE